MSSIRRENARSLTRRAAEVVLAVRLSINLFRFGANKLCAGGITHVDLCAAHIVPVE